MPHLKRSRILTQLLFWGALLFAFYEAVVPPGSAIPLFPWDKAEHFAAFYVLTFLAVAAFPKHRLLSLAVALCGFGALIEMVQAISVLERDSDIKDWLADILGILAVTTPMGLAWWRNRAREQHTIL